MDSIIEPNADLERDVDLPPTPPASMLSSVWVMIFSGANILSTHGPWLAASSNINLGVRGMGASLRRCPCAAARMCACVCVFAWCVCVFVQAALSIDTALMLVYQTVGETFPSLSQTGEGFLLPFDKRG